MSGRRRSDKERSRGDRAVWAADPDGGTVGCIAGAAAQASYAFDTVLGEGVSNAEVRACSTAVWSSTAMQASWSSLSVQCIQNPPNSGHAR